MDRSALTTTIVSVGYERREIEDVIALLSSQNVDVLVDVRENAVSRKRGFSKTALANALGDAGIEYHHARELGNPKDNRDAFRQGTHEARERYRRHLRNGASGVYTDLLQLAHTAKVALLCYEREHDDCHRSCITAAAQAEDPDVAVLRL